MQMLREQLEEGEGGLASHLQLVKEATLADLERRLLVPELDLELKAKMLETRLYEQHAMIDELRGANRKLKDDLLSSMESGAAYRDALRQLLVAGSDSVETAKAAAAATAAIAEEQARERSMRLAGHGARVYARLAKVTAWARWLGAVGRGLRRRLNGLWTGTARRGGREMLASTWRKWQRCAADAARIRSVCETAIRRMASGSIAAVFGTWVQRAAEQRHAKAVCKRVTQRWLLGPIASLWQAWADRAAEMQGRRGAAEAKAANKAWQRKRAGFDDWESNMREQRRVLAVMQRAARRMAGGCIAAAFGAWADNAE